MPTISLLKTRPLLMAATALVLALSLAERSHAEILKPIVWGTPTDISGDGDVVNTGTLFGAYNVSPIMFPGATVNGVPFAPFEITSNDTTVGNFRLFFDIQSNPQAGLGSGSVPFAALSPEYRALLGTGATDGGAFSIQMTINGLTNGQQYLIQWWTNFAGWSDDPSLVQTTAAAGGNEVTLSAHSATAGGLGQWVTGTFTAIGTDQTVEFYNGFGGDPLLNAFQVRAVPEPGSAVLLLGSGLLLALRRRRSSAL